MDHEQQQTTPSKRRFEYSEYLSERKRTLFPSQDSESDSDLGQMLPLENSSSPERYESLLNVSKSDTIDLRYFSFFDTFKRHSEENEENQDPVSIISPIKSRESEEDILEILAVNTPSPRNSPVKYKEVTSIPETPVKSPTAILKTPHDNPSSNMELPRLIRKSLLDISNIDKSNLKRKSDSPIENMNNKNFKFDHSASKQPKARTALFTENENEIILSAKSFYGKTENSKLDISFKKESSNKKRTNHEKSAPVYLCSRGNRKNHKKYFGQINAGVRHGIRKPKQKSFVTKTQLLKAALSIVKNSPLNGILNISDCESITSENECGVSLEQIKKMDSILKNSDNVTEAKPLTVYTPETFEANTPPPTAEASFNLKRPLSPQPVHHKKFFKSSPSKATVAITNNIKLRVDHGEISLIQQQNKIKKPQKESIFYYDMSDLSCNEEKIIDDSFTDILKSLEDDQIIDTDVSTSKQNPMTESIQTQTTFKKPEIIIDKNVILSPTSLMCNLTSGLALDSPKSQTTLTAEIDLKKASFKKRISFPETMSDETKLYPIFYGKQKIPKQEKKESRHVKNIRKIWKPLSGDQTLIDAGQKKFGVIQCPECKVIYSVGEPEDEIMHYNYHNSIGVFKYNNWKHERVVNQFHNGKVIQINPNDPKNWWKKIKEIVEVINKELGFVDTTFEYDNKKVFLCIMNKQIVGCLISEPRTQAYKMLTSTDGVEYCSEESYPVKCGISRIWVTQTHRKKGIATCMLNAMRSHFMYGHILSTKEFAFSAPTESGKKFAEKYTKTDNFFIYTS